jgi:hypothetical protein
VNLSGTPSKVGGTLTGALGFLILFGGTLISLVFGLVFGSLVSGPAGLAVGLTLGAFTLVAAIAMLFGARSLWRTGEASSRSTQEQAIFALASHRGGVLRAADLAQALDMPLEQADAQLTELAKRQVDSVSLELDDNGEIYYRFGGGELSGWEARARARVSPPSPIRTRVSPGVAPGVPPVGATTPEELELAEEEARFGATRRAAQSRA